jgi:NAD-dependent dihydropyrimidine dehydrogenase PreA subunit
MYMVSINREICTGCKECTELCPSAILGVEDDKAAVVGDASECMGCLSCVAVCESGAVKVDEY